MKRYFFDTEFLDDAATRTIELISIAIVCDDGRELYLGNSEFDRSRADDWLNANVMPQLPPIGALVKFAAGGGPFWRTRDQIRDAIAAFIVDESTEQEPRAKPEIWAFYASYDWVIFCQLFGKMINLPKHFPWLVNDLKTWAAHIGFKGSFKDLLPTKGHHDALEDARWNRDVYKLVLEHVNTKTLLT